MAVPRSIPRHHIELLAEHGQGVERHEGNERDDALRLHRRVEEVHGVDHVRALDLEIAVEILAQLDGEDSLAIAVKIGLKGLSHLGSSLPQTRAVAPTTTSFVRRFESTSFTPTFSGLGTGGGDDHTTVPTQPQVGSVMQTVFWHSEPVNSPPRF